jgi:hypothetical protein
LIATGPAVAISGRVSAASRPPMAMGEMFIFL